VAKIEKPVSSSRWLTGSIEFPALDQTPERSRKHSNTQKFWLDSIFDSSTVEIAKVPIINAVKAVQSVDVKAGLFSNAHKQLIQLCR